MFQAFFFVILLFGYPTVAQFCLGLGGHVLMKMGESREDSAVPRIKRKDGHSGHSGYNADLEFEQLGTVGHSWVFLFTSIWYEVKPSCPLLSTCILKEEATA